MTPPIQISDRARALLGRGAMADATETLPPPGLAAALEALDRGETHYTDRPGIGLLRDRIAKALAAQGLAVTPDTTIVTCGVEEARFVTMTVLGADGIAGVPEGLLPLASLCGAALRTNGGATWSTASAPVGPVAGVLVQECAPGQLAVPAGSAGEKGTVVIGSLALTGLLRTGFVACAGLDPKALRDFKQALTICTTNLSQWISLGLMEDQDANA